MNLLVPEKKPANLLVVGFCFCSLNSLTAVMMSPSLISTLLEVRSDLLSWSIATYNALTTSGSCNTLSLRIISPVVGEHPEARASNVFIDLVMSIALLNLQLITGNIDRDLN